MRGSIIELKPAADGTRRWRLRVFLGRDIVSGKPRHLSRNFTGARRDADKRLRELIREVEEGKAASTDSTVAFLLDEWLRLQEAQRLSPTTLASRISYCDHHIKPTLGPRRVRDITARDLDRLYSDIGTKLSPRTVRHIHATVHRALEQAVRWGWVDKNVADLASPPAARSDRAVAVDLSALPDILREARRRNPAIERMIALAAMTGARRGELCGIRWSDCDLEAKRLTIRRAVKWTPQRGVEVGSTKTHQERTISMDEISYLAIVAQMEESRATAAETGLDLPADPWLFPDDGLDAPMPPGRVSSTFRRIANTVGLPEIHFHSLRHFSATQLIAAGVDVRTVSGRLGHADPSVTLRVYSHALEAKDRQAADILGGLLSNTLGATEPKGKELNE